MEKVTHSRGKAKGEKAEINERQISRCWWTSLIENGTLRHTSIRCNNELKCSYCFFCFPICFFFYPSFFLYFFLSFVRFKIFIRYLNDERLQRESIQQWHIECAFEVPAVNIRFRYVQIALNQHILESYANVTPTCLFPSSYQRGGERWMHTLLRSTPPINNADSFNIALVQLLNMYWICMWLVRTYFVICHSLMSIPE